MACGAGDAQSGAIATPGPLAGGAGYACTPLSVTDARVRIATGTATELHAIGGSGVTTFALAGETQGATIEPGGGLHAGARAASFEAIARDGLCHAEARARIEVVGPFDVEPKSIVIARDARLVFAARGALGAVRYSLLDRPSSDEHAQAKLEKDTFIAGEAEGAYHIVARDAESGDETRLTVTVGKPIPLRPRAEIFAVPSGGRIRLDFRGGSERVEPLGIAGPAGGKVSLESEGVWFDARGARAGIADVTVRDRFTHETAKVRVLVGETLGAEP
ncbi:MAG TPA: hypothetical protein VNO21_19645, partial [Polyangiaceae bacterium]|nr:hypothetical protein [Polyangiaceae bacterium]